MISWTSILWTVVAIAILSNHSYRILSRMVRLLLHTYFRKVVVFGINNLPREGPVILCPNHPNMLVDPLLVITECVEHGRQPYIWVKASLFANSIMAAFLNAVGCVPVFRPPKGEGSLEDKDSSKTPEELAAATNKMFEKTWQVLAKGNVMLLFPEGTSYTGPQMLKIRTGVVRVATGFTKKYNQVVPIVPVGLTYFKKDAFRSQVMLEFGSPFQITPDMVTTASFVSDEFGEVKRLTRELEERMRNVTLNAKEYSTIDTARVMSRLYLNSLQNIDANTQTHLSQSIINLIEKDNSSDSVLNARLSTCRQHVDNYRQALDVMRLKDQDIVLANIGYTNSLVQLFLERILFLLVLLPLATPGLLLNFPFYLIGKKLNKVAGFVESKSMFKIFTAAVLVPLQWITLILITWHFVGAQYAYAIGISLPVLLYSHIRVLEESRSIWHSVKFLFKIAAYPEHVVRMQKEREILTKEVQELLSSYIDPTILSRVIQIHSTQASSNLDRNRFRRASSLSEALLH